MNKRRILTGLTIILSAGLFLIVFPSGSSSDPAGSAGSSSHESASRQRDSRRFEEEKQSSAQASSFLPGPPQAISRPDLILPRLDHESHLAKARELEKEGRYLFAVARKTNITPDLGGRWQVTGDQARWHYQIRSTGAESLNLAFSEFQLPPSATLTLTDPSGQSSPISFTSEDNDDHGELWTPIFDTEDLLVTLDLPTSLAPDLRLRLSQVNHGFRSTTPRVVSKAMGDSTSGSCNIDVVCNASNDASFGPLVNLYRDQIRSVAAYTLSGVETCSGALINNTRNDLTPYFLTADHCSITPSNAPSIVVYWNFENSTCRTPNSSVSGGNGNGPITQFNSGSIFRATRSATDFCLIELDDRVSPSFDPFFAGWDRRGNNPETSVAIHHPGVSEKRISFELDPTTITSYSSNSPSAGGTHFRVSDWDFGTTEGGSSGSPLFDGSGRIVGQLHGGSAACGNNLPDWYGRLSRSWSDGSSAASRLSDWLDPGDTGAQTLRGINVESNLSIRGSTSLVEGDIGNTETTITLSLSAPVSEPVSVTLQTQEGTATNDDFVPVNQRITFPPNQTTQTIRVAIIGDTTPEENETFQLALSDVSNATLANTAVSIIIRNDDFIPPVIDSSLTDTTVASSPYEYRISARNTPTTYGIADGPAGMTIQSLTGVLSWTPTTVGTETVTIIASNSAGSDSQTLEITIEPNNLGDALDLPESVTITNNVPGWVRQNEISYDSVDAAQSNPIGDSENATFSLQLTGPDILEYWYQVSTEQGFDFLSVSLDGLEQQSFSGESPWRRSSLVIPAGLHTVTFSYQKDGSISRGDDAVWLDQFLLISSTGEPRMIGASEFIIDAESDFTYPIESINPDATFTVTSLPPGLTFDGDQTISGQIATPGNYRFDITASANGLQESLSISLRVARAVGDSVELTSIPWEREGERIWFGQNEVSFDGVDAAQSGAIGHNESSTMSISVTGPDRLSFQWKVSSEATQDELAFLLDGENLGSVPPISGEQDWTLVDVVIPSGSHVLTWRYRKDSTNDRGEDAGWLDDLRFASGIRPMVWSPAQPILLAGINSRIPLEFVNSDSFSFENLPNWLTYSEESRDLTGTPPDPGEFEFTATATGTQESSSRTIAFSVQARSQELSDTLGFSNLIVTTAGDAEWESRRVPPEAFSGDISHNESSSMSLSLQGPGFLRFRWKVESERNYDFLSYSLNGSVMSRISGNINWEEVEVPLQPGLNQIVWTYEKDGSGTVGADQARLADLTLGGYARFLSENDTDHYDSTPFDDADGNGLSLLHEFAFLIPPGDSGPFEILTLSPLPDEGGVGAALEFDGVLPGNGVTYLIETTTDLTSPRWDRLTGSLESFPQGGNTRYRFTTPLPRNEERSLYFRVRARLGE